MQQDTRADSVTRVPGIRQCTRTGGAGQVEYLRGDLCEAHQALPYGGITHSGVGVQAEDEPVIGVAVYFLDLQVVDDGGVDTARRSGLTSRATRRILLTMLVSAKRDRIGERRAATRREILDAAWAIARESGLAQVTLRDVAEQVGMRAPSLYRHFESKNAIYDAMFADGWVACLDVMTQVSRTASTSARTTIKLYARTFFDFAVADLARYQLMNQRTIVGFEPSAESYAVAIATLDTVRVGLGACGVSTPEDVDLYVALGGGLVDAQLANDPGGDRWSRLLDRTFDMFADNIGIPT